MAMPVRMGKIAIEMVHRGAKDQTHPTNSQDLRTDHQHRVGWVNKGLGAGKGWWINTQKSAQA